jgi:hypothetical protein
MVPPGICLRAFRFLLATGQKRSEVWSLVVIAAHYDRSSDVAELVAIYHEESVKIQKLHSK